MLTIHGIPLSVHTRKVIVAARMKGLEHRVEPVVPFDPPQDWRALSPTGLIPAIEDDGFTLADSTAICAYFDRRRPKPPLYPAEPRALGRALWLEQYAGSVLFRSVIHPLFAQKVIRPHILKTGAPDQAEIDRIEAEVTPEVLSYLEGQAGEGFLAGDGLGIADIAVASNLVNYQYLGFAVAAARWPRLSGWLRRVLATEAFAGALRDEAPFAAKLGLATGFLDKAATA